MKIGDAIYELERSEVEEKRILNNVISRSGRCWEFFEKYSEKLDDVVFWSKTHNYLKIRGFRAETSAGKKIIIKTILDGLPKQEPKSESAFWKFYKRCIVAWSNSDHQSLDKLLASNEVSGNPSSSQDIFKSIMMYSDLYDVKKETLEDLYEIYWFQRLENFQEIISTKTINFEVVNKLISRNRTEIEAQIKKDENELKNLLGKIEKIEKEKQTNREEMKRNIQKIDQKIDQFSVSFQNQLSTIVSGEINKIKDKIEKTSTQKGPDVSPDIVQGLERKFNNKLKEVQLDLIAKISEIEEQNNIFKGKEEESNLKFSLSEIEFSKSLSRILPQIIWSQSIDIALRNLFESNRVFIFSSMEFVQATFAQTFNETNFKILCASPSWVDINDLLLAIGDEKEVKAKIFVIQNFDQGYVDGYLLPFLYSKNSDNFPARLILIPVNQRESKMLSSVLNHAVSIHSEIIESINSELSGKSPQENDFLLHPIDELVQIDKDSNDLKTLIKNAGVALEDGVFQLFCRYSLLFKKVCTHPHHLRIGYNLALDAYISNRYGNSKKEVVLGHIKGFLEI